jgi:hypothetical protein
MGEGGSLTRIFSVGLYSCADLFDYLFTLFTTIPSNGADGSHRYSYKYKAQGTAKNPQGPTKKPAANPADQRARERLKDQFQNAIGVKPKSGNNHADESPELGKTASAVICAAAPRVSPLLLGFLPFNHNAVGLFVDRHVFVIHRGTSLNN